MPDEGVGTAHRAPRARRRARHTQVRAKVRDVRKQLLVGRQRLRSTVPFAVLRRGIARFVHFMRRRQLMMRLLWICVVALGLVTTVGAGAPSDVRSPYACVCECCYRGDCRRVAGAVRDAGSCGDCARSTCNVSAIATSNDACVALFVAERDLCLRQRNDTASRAGRCARSAVLRPKCVDRSAPVQQLSCMVWLVSVVALAAWRLWSGAAGRGLPS